MEIPYVRRKRVSAYSMMADLGFKILLIATKV